MAGSASAQLSLYTGGEVGEGLDLSGTFLHALNLGGTATPTIQDVTFAADPTGGGASPQGPWDEKPEYGTATEDNALEDVTHSITCCGTATYALTAPSNQPVKLQLIFSENFYQSPGLREMEVFVEGVNVLPDFDGFGLQSDHSSSAPFDGTVYTQTLTVTDGVLNIVFTQGDGTPNTPGDKNFIANALTVEAVPEPAALAVLPLAASLLARRRRR